MLSSNENTTDKPLLFAHNKMSDNTDACDNAEQVVAIINALIKYDKSIKPDDIAIIMARSNESFVFYQLEYRTDYFLFFFIFFL